MRSVKTIAIAAIAASALCLGSAAFAQPSNDGFRPDVKCEGSSRNCDRPAKPGNREQFGQQGRRPEPPKDGNGRNFDCRRPGGNANGSRPEPPRDGKGPGFNGRRPDGDANGNSPEPPRDARNGRKDTVDPHDGRFHEYPREGKRD